MEGTQPPSEAYDLLENVIGRHVLRDMSNYSSVLKVYRTVTDKRQEGVRVSLEVVIEVDVNDKETCIPSQLVARVCPVYHSGPSRWSSNTMDDQCAVMIKCGNILGVNDDKAVLGKTSDNIKITKD